MTDRLERILDAEPTDVTSSLERDLIGALRPEDEARARAWRGIAAQTTIAAGAAGTAVTLGASTAQGFFASSSIVKGLLIASALAAPVGGAIYFGTGGDEVTGSAPQTALTAPSAAPQTSLSEPSAASQTVLTEPSAARDTVTSTDEPAAGERKEAARAGQKAALPADRLAEENRLLRSARDSLRAGDVRGAQGTLAELDRRFPRGALTQERELVRIQVHRAEGDAAKAEHAARRFLADHPKSPYAATVRTWVTEGDPRP